jgi:putative hemin transport protein
VGIPDVIETESQQGDALITAEIDEKSARIRDAFAANPKAMTVQLAREMGVPEAEIMRALPSPVATELDATRWEELIRALEPLGQVHVISTNHAVTLEAFGQFGNFSRWGDYFNVQTRTLDMHIRSSEMAAMFAVEKPSHMDGVPTLSIQFFDTRGNSAFKVFLTFGGAAPKPEVREAFDRLRETFRQV